MGDKKYNKVLNIVLVVVAIAIFAVIGFWGVDLIKKRSLEGDQKAGIGEFDNLVSDNKKDNKKENKVSTGNVTLNIDFNEIQEPNNSEQNGGETTTKKTKIASQTYKGFAVNGKIEIPSIKLSYLVLDRATRSSMEVSVGIAYGPGVNEIGNTVISGHNYRNGTFFSNLKDVQIGDKVYLTDLSGNKIKYNVYNKYETSSTDFDYATRDTAGKREVSLSTCTDDVQARLIIWACEEQ